ncbi:hypothetical protein LPJ61_001540 [Coemansia biformis]|uniref:Uncharacterized protein n=1 Tax=Coemansia biformis TaxID=1286918 RepID=A0A9W7YGI6_9FUNG|nr:hypothetical protein LPJ61_001540 [Coemansia biformis]
MLWWRHGAQTAGIRTRIHGTNAVTLDLTLPDGSTQVPVTIRRVRRWRKNEEDVLMRAIEQVKEQYGIIVWEEVARLVPERNPVSCRLRYHQVVRNSSGGSSGSTATRPDDGSGGAEIPAGHRSRMSIRKGSRLRWIPEEVELLRQLHAIYGNQWTLVAQRIEGRSPNSCTTKMRYLRETAGKVPNKHGPQPKARPANAAERIVRRVWTSADSDKLRKLLVARGSYNFHELSAHFPGYTYHQMYQGVGYVMAGQNDMKHKQWSGHERKALMQLAHEHDRDWIAVAVNMPTARTPAQCRLAYESTVLGRSQQRRWWTPEETARLAQLVDLSARRMLEPKLLRAEKMAGPTSGPAFGGAKGLPQRFQKLPGLPGAAGGGQAGRQPAAPNAGTRKAIQWPLVASHMDSRSAIQCRSKWIGQVTLARMPADVYDGPWSKEEDKALYTLYRQAPDKWQWIQRCLPRPRDQRIITQRYKGYIARYVKMLRECRGPSWDPLADDFEEVHHRCEIRAWTIGRFQGYRPQDPYPCPFDPDIPGCGE